jgi:hypothetical protein
MKKNPTAITYTRETLAREEVLRGLAGQDLRVFDLLRLRILLVSSIAIGRPLSDQELLEQDHEA